MNLTINGYLFTLIFILFFSLAPLALDTVKLITNEVKSYKKAYKIMEYRALVEFVGSICHIERLYHG